MLQNGIHILGTVVRHENDSPGLPVVLLLELFNFLVFLHYDAVEELVLVVGLIGFVVLAELAYVLLELSYFLAVLEGLGCDLSHLGEQVVVLDFFGGQGDALLVELEEGGDKLEEEEVVVADEAGDAGFGVESGAVGVAFVGDFVAQVVYYLFEGLEVADVLGHSLLGCRVYFPPHERVECFF
jgi:hypothetical protein